MWKGGDSAQLRGGVVGLHPPPPFGGRLTSSVPVANLLHMWPFKSKQPAGPRAASRLTELEERCDALERGLRGVRQGMEELDQRLLKALGKLTGALKRVQQSEEDPEGPKAMEARGTFVPPSHAEMQEMRRQRGLLRG